jgi:phosphatidylserine/phosphatidylglycerophosphate/cardiolipin synthase-like enzyme
MPRLHRSSPFYIKTSFILLAFIVLASACSSEVSLPGFPVSTFPGSILPSSISPSSTPPSETTQDWYTVYFTNPASPIASTYRGGIDENLVAAIDKARLGVDVAVYDLNLWSMRDALLRAHRRGVLVRIVTESDNMDEMEIQELRDAGIEVLGDRREGLMHHKFAIIDRSEVWTGSMNYTVGGCYRDNNNLLRIQSARLAEDYLVEFEQMFVEDHFGSRKEAITPNPAVTLNDSLLEAYFSPQDGTLAHILKVVSGATESIDFLAYSFTSDKLADALIERLGAGVKVRGVFDKDQYHSNEGTEFDRLLAAGIDVRLDGNPRLMHHKVIIIDQEIVVTGSYNFSNNAENNNDENTLIIHNQEIAAQYLAEFQQNYDNSQR